MVKDKMENINTVEKDETFTNSLANAYIKTLEKQNEKLKRKVNQYEKDYPVKFVGGSK